MPTASPGSESRTTQASDRSGIARRSPVFVQSSRSFVQLSLRIGHLLRAESLLKPPMDSMRRLQLIPVLMHLALWTPVLVCQDEEFLDASWTSILAGDLSDSLALDLKEHLLEFPQSAVGQVLLAEIERRRGNYAQAREHIETSRQVVNGEEAVASWARSAADLFLDVGDFERLAAALARGLESNPGDPALISREIVFLRQTGQRDQARTRLKALPATKITEDADPELLLEYCRAYLALGEIEVANRAGVFAELKMRKQRHRRRGEILFLLGEIFRLGRTDDGNQAFKAFHDALAADKYSTLSHLGAARTQFYRMRWDLAKEPLARAKALNPNHPDVLACDAEWMLYFRFWREALEVAERGLTINPNHRGLALARGAARFFLKQAGAEEDFQKVVELDPFFAEGFCRMGDLVAHHYRFAEAITFYERAIAVDPGYSLSYVGLAACLANTARTEEALESLARFRETDPLPDIHPYANNLREALSTADSFLSIERGPFVFRVDPLEAPVLVPLLTELYKERWKNFSQRYGIGTDLKVVIDVFPDQNDFSARTVGFTGFGALGVCFGSCLALVSPRSQLRGHFEFESTAVHELAHVVSITLSRQRVPRWLTEGISVHEEKVFRANCDREMDLELFHYYHSGEIMRVRELNELFSSPKILFGYFQSGLLVEFIIGRSGERGIVRMLELFAEDVETEDVIRRALGLEPEQLDAEFSDWLWRTRLSSMKVQPTYTELGLKRLQQRLMETGEPPAELLAQIAWAYHQQDRRVDRDDFLNRALKKSPSLPSAELLLARRALDSKDKERALRHFERALGQGAEEFFAFLTLADLCLADGKKDKRLEYLERAKDCFPRYVGPRNPYLLRSHVFESLGQEDNALEELRQYCRIQESDLGPRLTLSEKALERGDPGEALRYLLEVRAIDPCQRDIHRKIARCQRALSLPSMAVESLELALGVDPSCEPDFDAKLPAVERVSIDQAERTEILLDLVDIHLEVGETATARRYLERAVELAPDSPRILEIKARIDR